MKAIIYAGIGLFSVATVYGLTDYYSSKKSGHLEKLYADEEPAVEPKPVERKETPVTPVIIKETVLPEAPAVIRTKKTKKAKRETKKFIRAEDFSRARIPEPAVIVEDKPIEIKPEPVVEKPAPENAGKKEIRENPERKISLDMYSRAPLKKKVKQVKTEKQ